MDEGVVETMTWVWCGVMGGPVEVALLSTRDAKRRDAKSGGVVALAASELSSEGAGSLDEKHGRFHV
jgi:hypothetical protein